MDELDLIATWLAQFPLWTGAAVDTSGAEVGSCGVYPVGVQVVENRENVMGGWEKRLRLTVLVRRVEVSGSDAARWMLALQQWVNQQAQPPALGSRCQVSAGEGRAVSVATDGMAVYETKLTFEYGKEHTNA